MAKNIEIKATLDDVIFSIETAKKLSGSAPQILKQTDYFFNCESGRLKLRVFDSDSGELIFYTREDGCDPKPSEYFISITQEPAKLLRVLGESHGIKGIVEKTRKLFLTGRTRIHIDQVVDLGDFIEFEVVLSDGEDKDTGIKEAHQLMELFKIEQSNLIDCAYIDLLDRNCYRNN